MRNLSERTRNVLRNVPSYKPVYQRDGSYYHTPHGSTTADAAASVFYVIPETGEFAYTQRGAWETVYGQVFDVLALFAMTGGETAMFSFPMYNMVPTLHDATIYQFGETKVVCTAEVTTLDNQQFVTIRSNTGAPLMTVLPVFDICSTLNEPLELGKNLIEMLTAKLTSTHKTEFVYNANLSLEASERAYFGDQQGRHLVGYIKTRLAPAIQSTLMLGNNDSQWLSKAIMHIDLNAKPSPSSLSRMTPRSNIMRNSEGNHIKTVLKQVMELIRNEGEVYVRLK